ncbi:MAG: cystathionine beta-lyase [Rhizobacter sp.]|nr:cystathionine beta-lyase [Rhizobacter sp.]
MARAPVTDLIHHAYTPPAGFDAPQPGVFKASTVIFASTAAMRARDWKNKDGYTYGLHGTPTSFVLEERIAALEGGTDCLLVPSGLAAITLVNLALLESGDEVLLPDNAYGPGKELARNELARWGITHRLYDSGNVEALAAMIGPKTKLLWLEATGSVTMEFPDLRSMVAVARARGVITVLDNTWGGGIALRPFDLARPGTTGQPPEGVDIAMHALTKYPSGGGDILMGSVTTVDAALHLRLKATHMRLGFGVGMNDVETVLRSLPTLALRYAAHDASARTLAAWLGTRPEVAQVLHPALEGSPGHEHWASHCTAAAGLFSIVFHDRYRSAQIDAFVDALSLFKIGFSWAGPISLAVPYSAASMRSLGCAYTGGLVRFSIGLEDSADLKADLEQAFGALG